MLLVSVHSPNEYFLLTILNKFIMWKEFKDFAMKGNLIDMAVAFVMGGAFGKVVSSFTDGIVAPLIGQLAGGVDFNAMKWVLTPAVVGADGKETAAEVAVKYGSFITNIIDFLIVALVMFMIVKAMNKMKAAEAAAPPPPPPADIVLLEQIRDLLKR
jgi:large conductance mechanosensitive channel